MTWASGDDVKEVEEQQEQAEFADVAEDGRRVLGENEVAIDEDADAETGVGTAAAEQATK